MDLNERPRSGGGESAHVRNVAATEGADLIRLEREQRDGVAIVTDKFHFVGFIVAVDHDHSSDIAGFKTFGRKVSSQGDGIEFFDRVHDFGKGCAVNGLGGLSQAPRNEVNNPRGAGKHSVIEAAVRRDTVATVMLRFCSGEAGDAT